MPRRTSTDSHSVGAPTGNAPNAPNAPAAPNARVAEPSSLNILSSVASHLARNEDVRVAKRSVHSVDVTLQPPVESNTTNTNAKRLRTHSSEVNSNNSHPEGPTAHATAQVSASEQPSPSPLAAPAPPSPGDNTNVNGVPIRKQSIKARRPTTPTVSINTSKGPVNDSEHSVVSPGSAATAGGTRNVGSNVAPHSANANASGFYQRQIQQFPTSGAGLKIMRQKAGLSVSTTAPTPTRTTAPLLSPRIYMNGARFFNGSAHPQLSSTASANGPQSARRLSVTSPMTSQFPRRDSFARIPFGPGKTRTFGQQQQQQAQSQSQSSSSAVPPSPSVVPSATRSTAGGSSFRPIQNNVFDNRCIGLESNVNELKSSDGLLGPCIGAGDLGSSTHQFLDFLQHSSIRTWQLSDLLDPCSAFAGNVALVNIYPLFDIGLASTEARETYVSEINEINKTVKNSKKSQSIRSKLIAAKMSVIRDACENLLRVAELIERKAQSAVNSHTQSTDGDSNVGSRKASTHSAGNPPTRNVPTSLASSPLRQSIIEESEPNSPAADGSTSLPDAEPQFEVRLKMLNELRAQLAKFVAHFGPHWLNDWTLFATLSEKYPEKSWNEWPSDYANRDMNALLTFAKNNSSSIIAFQMAQFLFAKQWTDVYQHAQSSNITIVSELDAAIGLNSADAWNQRAMFKIDKTTNLPTSVYSETDTPAVDWEECSTRGFRWWGRVFHRAVSMADAIAIPSFNIFTGTVERDVSTQTTSFIEGPGLVIFEAIESQLQSITGGPSPLPFIALPAKKHASQTQHSSPAFIRESNQHTILRQFLLMPSVKIAQNSFGKSHYNSNIVFRDEDADFERRVGVSLSTFNYCSVPTGETDSIESWISKDASETEREFALKITGLDSIVSSLGKGPSVNRNIARAIARSIISSNNEFSIFKPADLCLLLQQEETPESLLSCSENVSKQVSNLAATFSR